MPADQRPMRFGFLDGLRGWAAVIVLFHHVFVDGLPANDFMADRLFWARIFFMNGTFAVVRSWRLRTWMLATLFVALALSEPFFSLFIAGILIADVFRQDETSRSRNIAGATLCAAGLLLTLLPAPWVLFKYVAAPVCLVAGVAMFAPARRLFENRLGNFLGWISFPLYLVQAAVIYSFSVRGLDLLASFGFEATQQRWIVGLATLPVAIFFAVLFCPINDFAVRWARRFGVALFGPPARRPLGYLGAKSRPA
jgi:peptidoglycan/LPS O-acetylase OafA/YrhL